MFRYTSGRSAYPGRGGEDRRPTMPAALRGGRDLVLAGRRLIGGVDLRLKIFGRGEQFGDLRLLAFVPLVEFRFLRGVFGRVRVDFGEVAALALELAVLIAQRMI